LSKYFTANDTRGVIVNVSDGCVLQRTSLTYWRR